jgi:hypothetical protein
MYLSIFKNHFNSPLFHKFSPIKKADDSHGIHTNINFIYYYIDAQEYKLLCIKIKNTIPIIHF